MSEIRTTTPGLARRLKLDRATWDRIDAVDINRAMLAVVGVFGLIALSRFGGQLLDSPRAPLRIIFLGVWGWIGQAVAMWFLGGRTGKSVPLGRVSTAIGLAQGSLALIGMIMFLSTGILRINGPALVVSIIVLGLWLPALVVAAARSLFNLSTARAAAVALVPYVVWLAIVPGTLHGDIAHLL